MADKKICSEPDAEVSNMVSGINLKDQIYLSLLEQRKIIINELFTSAIIEKVVMQIFAINEMDQANYAANPKYEIEPIKIYINSEGGNVEECFSLISAIESSITPIITIVLGKAYSAGFLVAIAGHYRYAQAMSTMMYHQGNSIVGGTFSNIHKYAEYYLRIQTMVEQFVKRKTKMSKKQITEIFEHQQDYYLFTEEALKLGIIDGVI